MSWSDDDSGNGAPSYLTLRVWDTWIQAACGLLAFGGIAVGWYWLVFLALTVYFVFKVFYLYLLARRFSASGLLGFFVFGSLAVGAGVLVWIFGIRGGAPFKMGGAPGGGLAWTVMAALLLALGGLWIWLRRRKKAKGPDAGVQGPRGKRA